MAYLRYHIILTIISVISLSSCNIKGYKYEKEFTDVSNLTTAADSYNYTSPNKEFSIRVPSGWDLQEDYADTIYGIFMLDTASFNESHLNFQSLAITKHSLNGRLKSSFEKDLSLMHEDVNEKVIKIGKEKINDLKSYWVLSESKNDEFSFYNLTYFTEIKNNQSMLLQISVYKTDDYLSKITGLVPYVHSFKAY
jgi:hypothetical protein